jgi:Ca2+-binding EF-hand superfamily protein
MRSTATVFLTALLSLSGAVTRAEQGKPPYDPRAAFGETDANRDGEIDREEFHERIVEVFYSADRNKDGFLEVEEQKQLVFPEDFRDQDRDHDGRISMREFLRVRLADYDKADTDDDGSLSLDEVVVAYERKKTR